MREITSVFACSDDLVLEILKNVQANVALLRDDMASVKAGITSVENRLDRIENRLGLIEA